MNTLVHADIFFAVTTAAVIVVTLLVAVLLIYLIMVLNRIKDIAEQVREEAVLVREDIHDLRDGVRREGFKLKHLVSFGERLFFKKKNRRRGK